MTAARIVLAVAILAALVAALTLAAPAGPGPTEPCACRAWQPCALGTVI